MNLRNKEEKMINPNVGAVWPPLMLGLREQLRGYIWFASMWSIIVILSNFFKKIN